MRRLLIDRGGLIALAVLALYLCVAPSRVVDSDNAEFATLGAIGGVAHPSGYPLYVLWLRAMSWLPAASPAHTAAIATVLLAVAQVVVLHAACRAWGARPLAATLAVAVYASGPFVMRTYCEAEVFALNGLIVAAILWLAADHGPVRGAARAGLLGLVAGLGMANHLTCVLALPIGVLGFRRAAGERGFGVAAGCAIAGFVLGLLPYAYLFVAPDSLAAWPPVHDVGELLDVFLRRAYGGPGAFAGEGAAVTYATSLAALAATVGRSLLWLPPLAGVAVLGYRIARPAGESRWAWIALAMSCVLAGPVLVLRFNVDPVDMGLYVVRRFHLLLIELLVIPIAAAIDLAARRWLRDGGPARLELVGAVLGVVVLLASGARSLPHLLSAQSPAFELGARNTLRSLPEHAVIIADAPDLHNAINYLELATGERSDVLYVHWLLAGLKWGRDRLAAHGLPVDTHADGPPSVRFADEVLAAGRPLFVDEKQGNILRAFPSYPYGTLIRVLPRGATVPSVEQVLEINKQVYSHFDLGYQAPGGDDEFATLVHRRYAQTWKQIGDALRASGRTDDAAWAYSAARDLAPH